MSTSLHPFLETRLRKHQPRTAQSLLLAARELVQEMALLGLARAGFFKQAAFHGGTALRIFYGLDRFSEDLDFCLLTPNKNLNIRKALTPVKVELESWGLKIEIVEREKVETTAVKKAFLKESSLGALLSLEVPVHRNQKFKIKIEIDSNPPSGARCESKLCEFPTDFYITCHDATTMFAGKLHALLTRSYVKGRDWYDLIFYLTRRTPINLPFLHSSLLQQRPQELAKLPDELTPIWVHQVLKQRLNSVNLNDIIADVEPFVSKPENLSIWSEHYFLDKFENYFSES